MIIDIYATRTPCKNGQELDAIEGRRYLKWADSERAAIKRDIRRRVRRQVRQALRTEFGH